jgi:hypothetical protein
MGEEKIESGGSEGNGGLSPEEEKEKGGHG